MAQSKVAVVAGVGPGNGTALAARFSQAGYAIAALARQPSTLATLEQNVPSACGYVCDVGDPSSVAEAFQRIRTEMGNVDTLLFNAGSGVFKDFDATSAEDFERSWRVNAYGSFLCAKEVVPPMRDAGSGNIVFIGATASRRGAAKTSAFAAAKAAQRSLAESLARSFWPHGIHVALIVVDGKIAVPGKTDQASLAELLDPAAIAETALHLCRQDKSAWSFEVEARPSVERW